MNEEEQVISTDDAHRDSPPWPGDLDGVDEDDDGWVLPPECEAAVTELLAEGAAQRACEGPWRQLPPGAGVSDRVRRS